jgi:signal transduction histidine kinase
MLSTNKGRFPTFYDEMEDSFEDMMEKNRRPHGMSRDIAEGTRFFSVLVDSQNKVVFADVSHISAVDADSAYKYATKALKKEKHRGFINDYRYVITQENYNTRVIFMDCTRLLWSFRKFLFASIAMSVAGLAIVFVIFCYAAGRIVRPVAESYEKQKRFITDAGHEIKTPLAIIKANLDVMRMDLKTSKALPDHLLKLPKALPVLTRALMTSAGRLTVLPHSQMTSSICQEWRNPALR